MIQLVQLCDLILILIVLPVSHSLRFELQSGKSKCIYEEIKGNSMSVGKYTIINPNQPNLPLPTTYNVSVRTASTHGTEYHTAEHVQSGQFAFTTVDTGDYMTCFWVPEHNIKSPTTLIIEFEWKTGIAAKDWSTVAKKGQFDVMELELKKLQVSISSIHDEMFYLREREEEMQELNESTNSKMALLSFLSLFVCLSVASLQIWHLKTFFQKKKII